MSCCPPGSWPALAVAQPGTADTGSMVDLGNNVQAYVVHPPPNIQKNGYAILSFQDIYEFSSARTKAVIDQFALFGYTVVHVDWTNGKTYFQGELVMEQLGVWVKQHSYSGTIQSKLISTVIPYILQKLDGISKIAAIGFCWGAYIGMEATADVQVQKHIVAVAYFHPSLALNAFFDKHPECNDVAELASKTPTLLVSTSNDPPFVQPNGSVINILQKGCTASKVVLMEEMVHGFVNRGDVNDPNVKRDVKIAIELAAEFLKEHLDNKSPAAAY